MGRVRRPIRVAGQLGIAVVGDDQEGIPGLQPSLHHALELAVRLLAGGHHRLEDAGVSDHVRIGEVQADEIRRGCRPHGPDGGLGHAGRAHRRLQVIGRHLGGRRHGALLSLELGLPAAAEEKGHVRVFLGLGQPELGAPGRADHLAHRHRQVGLVVEHLHALEPLVVVGHRDVVQIQGRHGVLGEILLGQGRGDLPAPVGPEIEAEHDIPRTDSAVHSVEDRRLHELVGDFCSVGGGHGRCRIWKSIPPPVNQQVVGLGDALPPLVPVHRPVPAANGGEPSAGLGTDGLKLLEVSRAELGRRVPTIGEGVDHHIGHLGIGGDAQQGVQVVLLAVDAPAAHQPHEVEPTALLLGGRQGLLEHGLGGDGPIRNGPVDAKQILIDNAAGPDVEVAHFAVAHLPRGQADVLTVRGERGVGVIRQ